MGLRQYDSESSPEQMYAFAKEKLTTLLAEIDAYLSQEVQQTLAGKDFRFKLAISGLTSGVVELRGKLTQFLQAKSYSELQQSLVDQKTLLNNPNYYARRGDMQPLYLQDLMAEDVAAFARFRDAMPAKLDGFKSSMTEVLALFFSQEPPFQRGQEEVKTEIQTIEHQIAILQQQIREKEAVARMMNELNQFFDQGGDWTQTVPLDMGTYNHLLHLVTSESQESLVPTWHTNIVESPQVTTNVYDEDRKSGKSVVSFLRHNKTLYLVAEYTSDPTGEEAPQRYFLTPDLAAIPAQNSAETP